MFICYFRTRPDHGHSKELGLAALAQTGTNGKQPLDFLNWGIGGKGGNGGEHQGEGGTIRRGNFLELHFQLLSALFYTFI